MQRGNACLDLDPRFLLMPEIVFAFLAVELYFGLYSSCDP